MEAARAARAGRRENLSLKLAPRARRQKESFDAAFEGFYREHVAEVYQYALAVLGNSADAEDVTQQTFLNAYRAFQRGERPQKAHNWLIKIAHNVCRMRWRQSGRRPQEVPLERAGEPAAPDDEKPSLDEVLKAAAIVATGVLAGGLGFKAANAIATPETPAPRVPQLQAQARPFGPSVLGQPAVVGRNGSLGDSVFRHPAPAVSGHGALRGG